MDFISNRMISFVPEIPYTFKVLKRIFYMLYHPRRCLLAKPRYIQLREINTVCGDIISLNLTRGIDHLIDTRINKGVAFTLGERQALGIMGLLPAVVKTQDEQVENCRLSLDNYHHSLNKYIYLVELQDRNEKLYFRLLSENVEKYMPIVYTPTVGLACQRFGLLFRRPRGLFITIHDKGHILEILNNCSSNCNKRYKVEAVDRDFFCAPMIRKFMLHFTPMLNFIQTHKILEDPLYIGLRQKRVRGKEYDDFIDEFMAACVQKYGQSVLLQFEDFAMANATRLLAKYRDQYCTFNDDIQGTASVAVAGLLAAIRVTKKKISENTFMFLGAGSAATGIAGLVILAMSKEGLTAEKAREKIYMIDIDGLLTTRRESGIPEHAKDFGRDLEPEKNFEASVKKYKPTCLIGCSTVGGAFTPAILKQMAQNAEIPIIFALSNPTTSAECTAQQAYDNTNGKCLFVSGSPFPPVDYQGKKYHTGQGNNAYIFPGLALGVIVVRAYKITDEMFLTAAQTLANFVTEEDLSVGRLYPPLQQIQSVSLSIAVEVCKMCYTAKLASLYPRPQDLKCHIKSQLFNFGYECNLPITYTHPPLPEIKTRSIKEVYQTERVSHMPPPEK
ncbi:PREDICTED: NADP-dependent malic enzyme-like [Papilio polytes]|uniref:NADP-dependent malic enzyme-like n=1 Tax=Papilio polytes TaxID=76194 RepID=UPI000676726B|nr:PREDICTED: NADP-dependent malic enzyme-like [Papilio polytes]